MLRILFTVTFIAFGTVKCASNSAFKQSPVDVMFVLDGSGSVGRNFEVVKDWVVNISSSLNLDEGVVKAGVVQYSHWFSNIPIMKQPYIKSEVLLGAHSSAADFKNKVKSMTLQGYTTFTGHALEMTKLVFEQHGRPNACKMLVLVTDGRSDDPSKVQESSQDLRDANVTTIVVGLGSVNIEELRIIATGDNTTNAGIAILNNFKAMNSVESNVKSVISLCGHKLTSSPTTPTSTTPDLQQFTTTESKTTKSTTEEYTTTDSTTAESTTAKSTTTDLQQFTTTESARAESTTTDSTTAESTTEKFTTTELTTENSTQSYNIDTVFLMDGSGSITKENFQRVKHWIKIVTNYLYVDGMVNVGVIQYSYWYHDILLNDQPNMKTEVALGRHSSMNFIQQMENIEQQGQGTSTGHALEKLMFDFRKYGRNDSCKVAVVITDGIENDPDENNLIIDALEEAKIIRFVVGVGNAQVDDLEKIASSDDVGNKLLMKLDDFDSLQKSAEKFIQEFQLIC